MDRNLVTISLVAALSPTFAGAAPITVDDSYTPDATVFSVPAPGVLGNDSTASGGLVVTLISTGGLQGTVSQFPDGRFTFTPSAGLATDTSYTYTATDASGGTSTATVKFDMVSTLPVAKGEGYTLTTPVLTVPAATGVLVNDTGGIGAKSVVLITDNVDSGSLSLFPDGRFTYTPSPGLATDQSFTYRIADALGRTSEATATIDMTASLPAGEGDSYTMTTPVLNVPAAGVLANDTGGVGTRSVVLITDNVDHGALSLFPDGRFTYTPNAGFAGIDAFTYRMADEIGRTSEAAVTIDLSTNLPVASDDTYDLPPNLLFDVAAAGVLGNDTGGIGTNRVVLITDNVDHGALSLFPDGRFSYTPNAGFIGIDWFDYRISDEIGRTDTATVELRVGVAPSDLAAVPEPGSLSLILLGATAALGATRRRPTI